jgi:hypothetical protein
MKRIANIVLLASLLVAIASSFSGKTTLKGSWQYLGGIYNGKKDGPPADYTLQRRYDNVHYNAFVLQKGYKPERYEAGDYLIKSDTCIETETFSSQPSKLTGIPVHYLYSIRNDSLIFSGTLPSGMVVEEYWKRVK